MSSINSTPVKKCSTCGIEKPTAQFSKKARMPDGLNCQCKACTAQAFRRYYEKHHDEMLERGRKYHAEHPKGNPIARRAYWARNRDRIAVRRKARYAVDVKLQEQNRRRATEWVAANLEHQRAKARAYYAANREKAKATIRAYWRANPEKVKWWGRLKANQRRARLSGAGGKYTEADVRKLYTLQKGHCANCRNELNDEYHVDHRTPVALGGSNDPHNLELLCPTCNMRKSAKLPHVFAQEEGRLL